MKKKIITLLVALMATVASVHAQQISVVAPNGATTLYRTFPDAIKGATAGSVVYLPGGAFTIPDSVKITKKLTIIGIGHKANGGNVDGGTLINGNLFFNEGSDGSAVMGCYLSGFIKIAEDGPVDDVVVRQCNLYYVQVLKSACSGIIINQNYLRVPGNITYNHNFSGCDVVFSNNITSQQVCNIGSGKVTNNIILTYNRGGGIGSSDRFSLQAVSAEISGNIISKSNGLIHSGNAVSNNNLILTNGSWGDNPIVIDADVNDIFVNYNNGAVSTASNFHFKDEYKEYESQVGIYAGTGFSDGALPPVPYIVAKKIDDKTDAAGKLNIKVRVKASE